MKSLYVRLCVWIVAVTTVGVLVTILQKLLTGTTINELAGSTWKTLGLTVPLLAWGSFLDWIRRKLFPGQKGDSDDGAVPHSQPVVPVSRGGARNDTSL